MRSQIIFSIALLTSLSSIAQNARFDQMTATQKPVSCIASFLISLPSKTSWREASQDEISLQAWNEADKADKLFVYNTLKKKGYISSEEVSCGNSSAACYGGDSYLDIQQNIGKNQNGDRIVGISVNHRKYYWHKDVGIGELDELGIYHRNIVPISYWTTETKQREILIDLLKSIPNCRDLKLQENRKNCRANNDCTDDFFERN